MIFTIILIVFFLFYAIALEIVYRAGKRTAKNNIEIGWHSHAAWCWHKADPNKNSIQMLTEVPFDYKPFTKENP